MRSPFKIAVATQVAIIGQDCLEDLYYLKFSDLVVGVLSASFAVIPIDEMGRAMPGIFVTVNGNDSITVATGNKEQTFPLSFESEAHLGDAISDVAFCVATLALGVELE